MKDRFLAILEKLQHLSTLGSHFLLAPFGGEYQPPFATLLTTPYCPPNT